jgi:dolichol-phosphate mannosyltransferase/undecaprenyl-phosphate 4-deoxy-4-formamido-L-arabinose transferase
VSTDAVELTWVLPLFRTSAQLQELAARISAVSSRLGVAHEVILVDDACPEGSGEIAERLARADDRLRVLRLPRNRGQDRALRAGIALSRGAWTVVLDADLQDPPEAIEALWAARAPDLGAVFTRRTGRYSSRGRLLTSRLYRAAIERIGGLPRGACLYVLMSRAMVDRINQATGTRATLLPLIAAARLRCASVDIVRSPRRVGHSAYSSFARSAKAMRSLWEMFSARRIPFRFKPRTPPMDDASKPHAAEREFQVAYFATRRPIRMLAMDTPYVRRHHAELTRAAGLAPGESVCEWGSGLGRFSRLLLADGLHLDAIELSPTQAEEARASLAGQGPMTVHCGDIAEVLDAGARQYDAIVGYFMLHHLPELERYFRSAHAALRPGGRMVFVEPNPFHPLFALQVTFTPGMRWKAERGIYRLTPGGLRRAAERAGFNRLDIGRYGSLPRAPYNWLARSNRQRMLEPLLPDLVKPFQTIVIHR